MKLKTWQIVGLAILGLAALVGSIILFRYFKKKSLISAIMAKDGTKTKLQLQAMSISSLQTLLSTLQPAAPPSHPGDHNTNPVNPNGPGNTPPPAPTPPPAAPEVMKNGSKLFALTRTQIYKSYSVPETDWAGDNVYFEVGEYVGQIIQNGPFGGMIHVRNYSTDKIDQNEFFVPNKTYTITN